MGTKRPVAGFETPYIPGWDCHGLPIEFKVVQDAREYLVTGIILTLQ